MIRSSRFTIPFTILICICISCSDSSTSSDSDTDDPEPNPNAELDCERLGYPCSLADVPEDVYEATYNALREALLVRENGTMEDVVKYLEELPNIVELDRDDELIRFRFVDGTPTFFLDVSNTTAPQKKASNIFNLHEPLTSKNVVGEDQTGDDKVNNRDHRRGLVLAPYFWQFNPYDESPLISANLSSHPEYQGHVNYIENTDSLDQKIQLNDYSNWDQYDTIFISTHGTRGCWRTNEGEVSCGNVVISSGVFADFGEQPMSTGAVLIGAHNGKEQISSSIIEYGLRTDFFRDKYPSGLDNTLVVFSACETGASGASELADAIGGDNFVMMGWTEVVRADGSYSAVSYFLELLGKGLSAKQALNKLEQDNLTPFTWYDEDDEKTRTTTFTHFAPNGGDQRIREIIELRKVDGGLEDGDLVVVEVKDGSDYLLDLVVIVDGVMPNEVSEYNVKLELEGEPIGENYNLSNATKENDYSYRLELPDVNTGQRLNGRYELEAIVDLPEGGESRYEVDISILSCWYDLTLNGGINGVAQGPAAFEWDGEGNELDIELHSSIIYAGTEDQPIGAGVSVPAWNGESGEFSIDAASATNFVSGQSALWFADDPELDCPGCGGQVTIDEASDEVISGTYEATLYTIGEDRDNPPAPTVARATFRAALSTGDPFDAYSTCVDAWLDE